MGRSWVKFYRLEKLGFFHPGAAREMLRSKFGALQRRWSVTCNIVPRGGDGRRRLRRDSRGGVVTGNRRWGLVASGTWRQVPWVEKVVVGLLRLTTWAAMAS
jgi:hypothetical protein